MDNGKINSDVSWVLISMAADIDVPCMFIGHALLLYTNQKCNSN